MKLEQQVCSLGLAKILKELGVRQESLYCWKHNTMSEHGPIDQWVLSQFPGLITSEYFIAAFTLSELEVLLPFETEFFREKNGRSIYGCRYEKYGRVWEETRADSAARMLQCLIEVKGHEF